MIINLPEDIIIEIIKYSDYKTIKELSLTCRFINDIIKIEYCKNIKEKKKINYIDSKVEKLYDKIFKRIHISDNIYLKDPYIFDKLFNKHHKYINKIILRLSTDDIIIIFTNYYNKIIKMIIQNNRNKIISNYYYIALYSCYRLLLNDNIYDVLNKLESLLINLYEDIVNDVIKMDDNMYIDKNDIINILVDFINYYNINYYAINYRFTTLYIINLYSNMIITHFSMKNGVIIQ